MRSEVGATLGHNASDPIRTCRMQTFNAVSSVQEGIQDVTHKWFDMMLDSKEKDPLLDISKTLCCIASIFSYLINPLKLA